MWRTLLKIRWKCDSPRNEHSFLSFLPPRVVLILLQKTREDLENVYFWVKALFNGSAWVRWWVFGGVVEMLGWGLTRQSHADSVSDALNAARSTRGKTAGMMSRMYSRHSQAEAWCRLRSNTHAASYPSESKPTDPPALKPLQNNNIQSAQADRSQQLQGVSRCRVTNHKYRLLPFNFKHLNTTLWYFWMISLYTQNEIYLAQHSHGFRTEPRRVWWLYL